MVFERGSFSVYSLDLPEGVLNVLVRNIKGGREVRDAVISQFYFTLGLDLVWFDGEYVN